MTAMDLVSRGGQWEELEGVGVAVVAGEVPAAGGGEAEAGVVGGVAEDDDPVDGGRKSGVGGRFAIFRPLTSDLRLPRRGTYIGGTYTRQAAALGQAGADEGGAEALVLVGGEDGDGGQAEAGRSRLPSGTWIGDCGLCWRFGSRGARGTYFCRAEEDVTDDLPVEFRDEGDGRLAALDEQGDKASFEVSGKGGAVDGVDGGKVGWGSRSDAWSGHR